MPTNFDPNRYVQDLVASFRSKDPEPYLRHYAENAELRALKVQAGLEREAQ